MRTLTRCTLTITALAAWLPAPVSQSYATAAPPRFTRSSEMLDGLPVFWLAEPTNTAGILLDANNGFFDKGAFRAEGPHAAPESDQQLIKSHFTHLIPTGNSQGQARWHVDLVRTGTLTTELHFAGASKRPAGRWVIQVADRQHEIAADMPPQRCEFEIRTPGRHIITLSYSGDAHPTLSAIKLSGPATQDAQLLRARWRPAAVHTQYSSSTCPRTRMWVFESQSLASHSSYSPISTQFGYFGGSFNDSRQAVGNLNFSVWAASRGARHAPALNRMPHLTATGNPEAEFGGFGHEGSGVKIRNWDPLSHHPASIIQALRVETRNDTDTFTGYFFDERQQRWVLFAQAKRPAQYSRTRKPGDPAYLRAASFCEIPGPPAVERSGDQRRIIRRRGWFFGADQEWHMVDRQTTASDAPTNRYISATEGWFLMATGGMEMVQSKREVRIPPSTKPPAYLSAGHTEQLFRLPVEIGASSVTSLTKTSASVHFQVKAAGSRAAGTLYYGPRDCLTFVSRTLHATERSGVSSDMLSRDRTWAHATKQAEVIDGTSQFELQGLQPKTKYFYRLLVVSDNGKCWAADSGSFSTQ